jgi:hypothetical protein
MSMYHDPDLDDVLQDAELQRLAALLRSTQRAEPPLDEAFRTGLRRQLMQQAWGETSERRAPWWRRLAGPPALAWAGAAAGILLIASVVVFMSNQPPAVLDITSPIADDHSVQLQQAILVKFNQPMEHPSTEAAVQIKPATYVAFSWSGNTLAVQPTSGNLAPNTQYQVTIGPGAKTQSGQQLSTPKTITFVTQPAVIPPQPSPTPTVRATPNSLVASERRLAGLASGTFYTPQWSADSTTVYLIGDKGALDAVTVSDGSVKIVVPDGVSFPAIAPAGDRIAYVRGGKIEILTLATGATADVTAAHVTAVRWAKDQLLWGTNDGVFKAGDSGPTQLAAIPQDSAVVSIAPDGAHAVYQQGQSLSVLDIATSKATQFGVTGGGFLGWSPDGGRMLYQGANGTVVADSTGRALATIVAGDPSWSIQNEILIGNDTDLSAVRPDGYGLTKLSSGTYHLPLWAPNGTTFAYVRGGAIWTATTGPLSPEPSTLDQGAAVVNSFMNARLKLPANIDVAKSFLDDKGKQAYSSSGLPLLISGDSSFSRYYVLTQEIIGSRPDTVRFVVRLVLTKGTQDISDYEETLTLLRDQASQPFLIDQATASPTRDLGKGAEVVSVEIAAGSIKVVFDSDLVSSTVADGVVMLDATGKRLGGASTYANRTVIITGLELAPAAPYKLVVLTTVQDVGGRNIPAEYDLTLLGPAPGTSSSSQGGVGNPPPQPTPAPSPAPSPEHSPTATPS